jgi:hypothetical protein
VPLSTPEVYKRTPSKRTKTRKTKGNPNPTKATQTPKPHKEPYTAGPLKLEERYMSVSRGTLLWRLIEESTFDYVI